MESIPGAVTLADKTSLIPMSGCGNVHNNHYHVGTDGTVLSIKVNGTYYYNRGGTRKQLSELLREVDGTGIPTGWHP